MENQNQERYYFDRKLHQIIDVLIEKFTELKIVDILIEKCHNSRHFDRKKRYFFIENNGRYFDKK